MAYRTTIAQMCVIRAAVASLFGVRLAFRRGRGEGGQRLAGGIGGDQARHGAEVHAEAAGIVELRDQAKISQARLRAEAERTFRHLPRQRLAGVQPLGDGVMRPGVRLVLVWPSAFSRFSTFRFCTAWISQAMARAKARTRARITGSAGSSGGIGWVSSRYSMMARTGSAVPSSSARAGTSPWG